MNFPSDDKHDQDLTNSEVASLGLALFIGAGMIIGTALGAIIDVSNTGDVVMGSAIGAIAGLVIAFELTNMLVHKLHK